MILEMVLNTYIISLLCLHDFIYCTSDVSNETENSGNEYKEISSNNYCLDSQEHAYSPEGFKNDTKTIYFQCNSYQSQEIRQNRSFPQSFKSLIKKLRENENDCCDSSQKHVLHTSIKSIEKNKALNPIVKISKLKNPKSSSISDSSNIKRKKK
ncbi:hypothetical protein CWI37_1390p0010 [Hamiltosporidium tvaerminnensis]|uniref:Uncharacterized protein n=1 Tax=Hamiltosporidium tvaerminnensis TaxID=1176355 RepID=A0A4Q9KWN7_9MICR|nr:hypothetical protein LUQ84_002944 [Hamiltosporidium tvaerminnensis]TBT99308.1 hypothetical protein CWI37_1390p0010 [Hamiltosporidium tvaerminnensis]